MKFIPGDKVRILKELNYAPWAIEFGLHNWRICYEYTEYGDTIYRLYKRGEYISVWEGFLVLEEITCNGGSN
jgi:hypothetical protein